MNNFFLVVTALVLISIKKIGVLSQNNDGTVVQIESGLIKGHILKSEKGNDYWAFQEIPYAEPPLGENRFQLPKLPKPWNGTLNTTKNTKICYQDVIKYSGFEMSEDCLHINVYTPEKPGSNKLLPVLLYIHGGGFIGESGAFEYLGPKYIMDHGIVVVTFDYRLGVFGFLSTDDGIIPVDCGLKDQVFAMEWVHRNIHRFGGNKSHVVINGESAGSMSVGIHLIHTWKNRPDLFQGAIMQSGSPISSMAIMTTGINATASAMQLVKSIDPTYTPKNTTDILRFLQKADAKKIHAVGITGLDSSPCMKGSFQYFLNRDYKKVPILMGFNSEEKIDIAHGLNKKTLEQVDADPSVLISKSMHMSPHSRSVAGALYKNVYTNGSTFVNHPGGYVRHISDTSYTIATCKQVELGSAHVPYYFYQFAYKGVLGGRMQVVPPPGAEKVGHTEDLNYMWDNGSNSDLNKFPKQDQLMLQRFVKMWTNFVKYLDPTPEADPLLENIRWLKSEPQSLRYLNINSTLKMQIHPRQYIQIKPILEKYMEPPFDSFT